MDGDAAKAIAAQTLVNAATAGHPAVRHCATTASRVSRAWEPLQSNRITAFHTQNLSLSLSIQIQKQYIISTFICTIEICRPYKSTFGWLYMRIVISLGFLTRYSQRVPWGTRVQHKYETCNSTMYVYFVLTKIFVLLPLTVNL